MPKINHAVILSPARSENEPIISNTTNNCLLDLYQGFIQEILFGVEGGVALPRTVPHVIALRTCFLPKYLLREQCETFMQGTQLRNRLTGRRYPWAHY